ncbi:YkgJ family cysteine cluster protein [Candidatus Woesearchaeota archaeon]|nr:YkgJ family cysteine cluster protein [Candidatus Woesearchaeota archaeon]
MEKFDCSDCGQCCHIRNNVDLRDEDVGFLVSQAKKQGLFYLADPRSMTFPMTRDEKIVLEKGAEDRDIDLRIRPLKAFRRGDKIFIINYFMDHKVCPFFDEKNLLCTCYDKRPLACRAFPILSAKHCMLGDCPKKIRCDLSKEGRSVYGPSYDHAVEFDRRNEELSSMIRELQ